VLASSPIIAGPYSSFGKIESQLDLALVQPYTYTAREFDGETNLFYYRARSYDPTLGRFFQVDPIGFSGGDFNLYAFVRNNPVLLVDRFGLQSRAEEVILGAVAIVGGGAAVGTSIALGVAATELLGAVGAISLGMSAFTAFTGTLELFHTMSAVGLTAGYAGVVAFAGGYTIGSGINYLVPPLREGRLGRAIYDTLHPEMNQIVVPVRRDFAAIGLCPISENQLNRR